MEQLIGQKGRGLTPESCPRWNECEQSTDAQTMWKQKWNCQSKKITLTSASGTPISLYVGMRGVFILSFRLHIQQPCH